MQDDVYALPGWLGGGQGLRELKVDKGEKFKETPDLVLGKSKYRPIAAASLAGGPL